MSIFRTETIACPACKTAVPFDLVHSVNAGRRADLRAAILDRSFQKLECGSCKHAFRMEPQFSYMDLGRGQFYAVWPAADVKQWKATEQRSQQTFDQAYGAGAPPEARDIGKKLTTRAVFGWPGLNEKIIAAEAGIDDADLELAKLALLRGLDQAPSPAANELRLLGVEKDNLVLGWFRNGSDVLSEVVSVSRALLAEIQKDAKAWKELRDELTAGMFLDYRRLFLPGE